MLRSLLKVVILSSMMVFVLVGTLVADAQKIVVGVEAGGPYSEFYKEIVEEFTAQTGIEVAFIDIPHEFMHERFLTEALGGTGDIDVYQADQPWVPEFAAAGFLEPLDDKLSDSEKNDFLPVALSTVTYQGKIYALPYLVHNSVMYCRTDLFEEAGFASAPSTWDEYRDFARKLTKDVDGDGKIDVFGTVVEGKQHIEAAAKFLDILYQAGGDVIDEKGQVVFDAQPTIDAFNFMLAIQYEDKTSPPGAPSFDCTDVHNLFLQGNIAMAPNWPYMYSMAADPNQSKVVGKWDIDLQPGKVSRCAAVFSWGYAVSVHSKNKDAAFQFVKWATSPEVLLRLGKKFTNPIARRSAMNSLLSDSGISQKAKDAISIMTKSVEISKSIPMIPEWMSVHERIALALSKIMTLQADPAIEVKEAANDIRKTLGSN